MFCWATSVCIYINSCFELLFELRFGSQIILHVTTEYFDFGGHIPVLKYTVLYGDENLPNFDYRAPIDIVSVLVRGLSRLMIIL